MTGVPQPPWLLEAFPKRQWQTLRVGSLRLGEDGSAGLDLEASELGYLVDDVADNPGQDPEALYAGAAVIGVEGVQLIDLDEEALQATFGEHFKAGAKLLTVKAEELRSAMAERELRSENCRGVALLEHGSVLYLRLGTAEELAALGKEGLEAFEADLETFSQRIGVRAALDPTHGAAAGDGAAASAVLVVSGIPEEVRASRGELANLLEYYSFDLAASALQRGGPEAAESTESIDMHGMVVRSMPARNRRKRAAPSSAEQAEELDKEAGMQITSLPATPEERRFEFLDHTADVILHSWGANMAEAWEQVSVAFFAHLTDLDNVEMHRMVEVEASGHDILDLLYHLLDEFLFLYGSEYMICRRVQILELDIQGLKVKASAFGEVFDRSRHSQGTEIKAITMHQMKILTPHEVTSEEGVVPRLQSELEGGGVKADFPYECYVLVDI